MFEDDRVLLSLARMSLLPPDTCPPQGQAASRSFVKKVWQIVKTGNKISGQLPQLQVSSILLDGVFCWDLQTKTINVQHLYVLIGAHKEILTPDPSLLAR